MDSPETRRPAILIIGAPGAGKGTQGKVLGTIPRFIHCACGDVFRSLDTRTPLGKRFIQFSSRGELVPDELTIELWKQQIDSWIDSKIYKPDIDLLVLDGIPRNVEQARILERHLEVHQLFHLSCPNRDELARRMRKRALKENRYDDASDEVIEHRIRTYEEETKPIIDFYSTDITTDVDATQQPAAVLKDILTKVVQLEVYNELAQHAV